MSARVKLAFVGGGSYTWAPNIIRDILVKPELPEIDFYLLDRKLAAAGKVKALAEKMNAELGTGHRFVATSDEALAFDGCDFVIICISTGGLDAMRPDLEIPQNYGIYQTVGDTTGPGGWSRNMRNVPVFNALAKQIEQRSNDAVVMNYTNPMACLTKAFHAQTKLRSVGLCHGLYETYGVLMEIFGLQSEDQIRVRVGGVNHFFWINEMRIGGQDGYKLLREKMAEGRSLADLVKREHTDPMGFVSNKQLASELFDAFGYLTYTGDRHTCEFLPHVITPDESKLARLQIRRTTVDQRVVAHREAVEWTDRLLSGEQEISYQKSREIAADIVEACLLKKEFIDVVNLPNIGQIPNLPLGGVVETLGVVNELGFTPLCAGALPEPVRRLVQPHLENSETIYQAATEGDFELALQALYNDPACAHLSYKAIRKMAGELLQANAPFLPQFQFHNGEICR